MYVILIIMTVYCIATTQSCMKTVPSEETTLPPITTYKPTEVTPTPPATTVAMTTVAEPSTSSSSSSLTTTTSSTSTTTTTTSTTTTARPCITDCNFINFDVPECIDPKCITMDKLNTDYTFDDGSKSGCFSITYFCRNAGGGVRFPVGIKNQKYTIFALTIIGSDGSTVTEPMKNDLITIKVECLAKGMFGYVDETGKLLFPLEGGSCYLTD